MLAYARKCSNCHRARALTPKAVNIVAKVFEETVGSSLILDAEHRNAELTGIREERERRQGAQGGEALSWLHFLSFHDPLCLSSKRPNRRRVRP